MSLVSTQSHMSAATAATGPQVFDRASDIASGERLGSVVLALAGGSLAVLAALAVSAGWVFLAIG